MRAKYKVAQVTDVLVQFINNKQEHSETLVDHMKQFKQSRDNVELILGPKFLDGFIVNTDACNNTSTVKEKKVLKDVLWDQWTAHM